MYKKMKSFLWNIEEYITLFFFFIMCIFIAIQIVSRYIMNDPLGFSDEIARYAYIWMTFIGLSLAAKHDLHVRVELINLIGSHRFQCLVKLVTDFGVMILLLIMLYLGFRYTAFSSVNRWASLPVLSMSLVNISLPIGCLIAVLRTVGLIVKNIQVLRRKKI